MPNSADNQARCCAQLVVAVEGIAAATEVIVVAMRRQHVVDFVVDPRNERSVRLVSFSCVVEDDV